MFSVFMGMLTGMGGSYTTFVPEPRKEPKPEREWAATSGVRVSSLSDRHHTRDSRGVVTRNVPKRDKSISARQWKKQVKSLRAAQRVEVSRVEVAA
jgi:hypothetical protein